MKILILFVFLCTFYYQGWAQTAADSLIQIETADIYFDFAATNIRADADSTLKALAAKWIDQTDYFVQVTAHTDSVGSTVNNMKLSEKRAKAVIDTLIGLGIPDSLFVFEVFGEQQPIAENNSTIGRQRNRRASISILRKVKVNLPDWQHHRSRYG